jgi:flagellar protein FliS
MGAMHHTAAIRQYRQSGVAGAVHGANPQQLIAMLLRGALDRVASARGAAQRGDQPARHINISAAMAIVDYLRLCLDRNAGGLAQRLDALYDYVLRRLFQANANDDARLLDEVGELLRTLEEGWETLPATGVR